MVPRRLFTAHKLLIVRVILMHCICLFWPEGGASEVQISSYRGAADNICSL